MTTVREFEATYRQMDDGHLFELAAEMDDLVPEARTALEGEFKRRGLSLDGQGEAAAEGGEAALSEAPGGLAEPRPSCRLEGPVPADWVRIPRFAQDECIALALHLDQAEIPYQILQDAENARWPFLLAVARDRLTDSAAAMKEYYGLLDELPELFTGDCPACGTHLEGVTTCSDCGLVLCQDSWVSLENHPFVKFLLEKGLGRPAAGRS